MYIYMCYTNESDGGIGHAAVHRGCRSGGTDASGRRVKAQEAVPCRSPHEPFEWRSGARYQSKFVAVGADTKSILELGVKVRDKVFA